MSVDYASILSPELRPVELEILFAELGHPTNEVVADPDIVDEPSEVRDAEVYVEVRRCEQS